MLYLIEILHQTTTAALKPHHTKSCILSKFYIKPQHFCRWFFEQFCCILSKFYIKPQQLLPSAFRGYVVSYRNSTSNHNQQRSLGFSYVGCILSKFYIKPQPSTRTRRSSSVVSYRNSTSNHNLYPVRIDFIKLYLIEILHQTTTQVAHPSLLVVLYLIEILHQTTTTPVIETADEGCILSKFYIKPQLAWRLCYVYRRCILSKFYIKPQPPTE